SETTSTGLSIRWLKSGAFDRTAIPIARGTEIVATKAAKMPMIWNCIDFASANVLKAISHITGVKTADSTGKIEVKPAANARSAPASLANTGTTGANGDAASRIMAMAVSPLIRKAAAKTTVSAGTPTKLASTIARNRHFLNDSKTWANLIL